MQTGISSAPRQTIRITDSLKTGLENIDFNSIDITDDQIEQVVQDAFKEFRDLIKKLESGDFETEETKADIYSAINKATGGKDDLNKFLAEQMGIDYEKLNQGPTEKLSVDDLTTTTTSTTTSTATQSDKTIPYLVVTDEVFEQTKTKTLEQFVNMRGVFENSHKNVLKKMSASFPEKLKTDKVQTEFFDSFFAHINAEYILRGCMPPVKELENLIGEFLFNEVGFLGNMKAFFASFSSKKVDLKALKIDYISSLRSEFKKENVSTKYQTIEKSIKACYKPGKYEKVQNDEFVLDNLYGGKNPDDMTTEELNYQLMYQAKKVELLESIDMYDLEQFQEEYRKGVLAGTIGVVYSVWFAKNKLIKLSMGEKMVRRLKPLTRVLTFFQNVFSKFFGEEEMTWAEVFDLSKKNKNKEFVEANEKFEILKDAQKKEELISYCDPMLENIGSPQKGTLGSLSYEQLQKYKTLLDSYGTGSDISSTPVGEAFVKLKKPSNLLLFAFWLESGAAKYENGKIMINNQEISLTDSNIEGYKAMLVLDDSLYTNWPTQKSQSGKSFKLSYTFNGSFVGANVLDPAERKKGLNKMPAEQQEQLHSYLTNDRVKQFLVALQKAPNGMIDSIMGGKGEYYTDKCISLDLLKTVSESSLDFVLVRESTDEDVKGMDQAKKIAGEYWDKLTGGSDDKSKSSGFYSLLTKTGPLPFKNFGDLIEILSQ